MLQVWKAFTRAGYAARPFAKYTLIIKIYFRILLHKIHVMFYLR